MTLQEVALSFLISEAKMLIYVDQLLAGPPAPWPPTNKISGCPLSTVHHPPLNQFAEDKVHVSTYLAKCYKSTGKSGCQQLRVTVGKREKRYYIKYLPNG